MDALAAIFAAAGLNVEVARARTEDNQCPMAGTFDLTFAAGSKPPAEVVFDDDEGHRVAIKLTRVPLIKPDPAPFSSYIHPLPAAQTAAAQTAAFKPTPLGGFSPMTYAAAAATPGAPSAGAATKPAAHGAAKAAAPGRAPPGKAAAPGSAANAPKRQRLGAAAKAAAGQRNQQKAAANPALPHAHSRERLPDMLDSCSHCFTQGHARAQCPNINGMDWHQTDATPTGVTDLPLNMETDAAAPAAGEQGPPAAVTASPRPNGSSA
jgi:hypothetical protein